MINNTDQGVITYVSPSEYWFTYSSPPKNILLISMHLVAALYGCCHITLRGLTYTYHSQAQCLNSGGFSALMVLCTTLASMAARSAKSMHTMLRPWGAMVPNSSSSKEALIIPSIPSGL